MTMDALEDTKTEKIRLIGNENRDDSPTDTTEDNDATNPPKKSVNLKQAFYIMISISIGVNILAMPFVVRQLGLVAWILCLTGIAFVLTLCTLLQMSSAQQTMEENVDIDVKRDAYPSIAEFACGRAIRVISVVFLFATAFTISMSFLLLAASILADLLPIDSIPRGNVVRIWTAIVTFIITPIMYLGNYSDVSIPAIVGFVTSVISAVGIFVNCALYFFSVSDNVSIKENQDANQNFLIPLGTLVFAMCGANITITNITVIAANPKQLPRSIISCNVCTFVILLLTGLVPYLAFKEATMSSTTSTFYQVINSEQGGGTAFKVVTIVIQVLMLVHLTMASILALNPVFLYIEDILKVAHDFNIKRVAIRTSCMLLILGICELVPEFEFAIGIAGGVPITVLCIFLPVLFYTKLFTLALYKKIAAFIFLVIVVLFIFGNLVASILNIVKN